MAKPVDPAASSSLEGPAFRDLQSFSDITLDDGTPVRPEIHCHIEKGFFMSSDNSWTCYRRNYFAVDGSYSLHPPPRSRLFLKSKPIQSLALDLSACVDGIGAKAVDLVQHTPKRDKGPQLAPRPVTLLPKNLQGTTDLRTTHSFERIQFKSATANNGKRRAAQQYYVIIVSLLADVRLGLFGPPDWVKVAQRCSEQLVIRGRSPSHYTNEAPNSSGRGSAPIGGRHPHYGLLTDNSLPRFILEELEEPSTSKSQQAANVRSSNVPIRIQGEPEEVLDDSSISSTQSRMAGSSRAASVSSLTSFDVGSNLSEQFLKLILDVEGIRGHVESCFALDRESRAERNIRRLLRKFATDLRAEASDPVEIAVARTLKRHSRQIASLLKIQCARRRSSDIQLYELALGQLPTSKDYLMNQFLSEPYPKETEPAEASTGDVHKDPSQTRLGHTKLSRSQNHQKQFRPEDPPNDNNLVQDDSHSSQDSDDRNSAPEIYGSQHGSSDINLSRGQEFFCNSDALKGFEEGLLDFRIAMENAAHNRMILAAERVGISQQVVGKISVFFSALWTKALKRLRRTLRPSVKPHFRRVEWICECGEELYADFDNNDPAAVDELEATLKQCTNALGREDTSSPPIIFSHSYHHSQTHHSPSLPSDAHQALNHFNFNLISTGDSAMTNGTKLNATARQGDSLLRHLAVCIPTGGMYKCLTEIDMSKITSDAELFRALKSVYHGSRKSKAKWRMFLKPVSVEFVQFSVWNIRHGYVSICDRPRCVPPKENFFYDFHPRPLQPLPPVPPEIIIHHLEHDDSETMLNRYVWTPRFPKRKGKRVIDCDIPTYGWGIYIREGPNRVFVFWMIMITVLCSILLCTLWASIKRDVQGGTGLGTLILALPSVIMAAFMFKVSDGYQM